MAAFLVGAFIGGQITHNNLLAMIAGMIGGIMFGRYVPLLTFIGVSWGSYQLFHIPVVSIVAASLTAVLARIVFGGACSDSSWGSSRRSGGCPNCGSPTMHEGYVADGIVHPGVCPARPS
ncbi:hypothetical protein [Pseudonocardia charpentierae]|uniref:Uncharacterized protein n=1 Tax=Pseudonocardia charpentierae TaxID=3075545 RepID=A0ABU2NKK3_9PSEU|nr:hypothetical protein [Pseudonocardia sp. DSM 45834]MDT0353968.1 hypothetical protein [Pseudonocardia sp. DSM 45834]